MANYERFEDLPVWQSACAQTARVYQVCNQGAFARDFGLRDQMRRAAVFILSNIAEGFETRTKPLFADYLGRARASCGERRAQLYVASDASYLTEPMFESLRVTCVQLSKQLTGFAGYIKTDIRQTGNKLREQQQACPDNESGIWNLEFDFAPKDLP
jgi:four helix bundle protein